MTEEKKLTDEELNKLIVGLEHQSWAQNFFELSQAAYMLKYQKAEIERLAWTSNLQRDGTRLYERRCEELQKQVDELKEKQVIECHGMIKGCDMVKQAVKDTAKEIFTDLLKEFSIRKSCGNADIVVREMAMRKGVEVE